MTDTLPSHASGSRAPAYLDPTFEDRIREAFHAGDLETLTNLTEPLLRARKSDSGWKSGWVALLAGVRGAFEEILEVNLSDAEPDLCLPLNTDGDPRGWLALINTQHVEDLSNPKFKGLDTLVELLRTSVYERLAAIGRRFAAPDNLQTPEVDELGRFLELLFITLRTTYDESFVSEGSGRGSDLSFAAEQQQHGPSSLTNPRLGGTRSPAAAPQPISVDAVAQPPARAAPNEERARTHVQAAETPVANTGIDIKPASRSPSPAPIRSGSPGARRVQPVTRSGHGAHGPLGQGVRTSTPIVRKASDTSSCGSVGEWASDFIPWNVPKDVKARLAALEAELRQEREKRFTENVRLQMVEALLANEQEERKKDRNEHERQRTEWEKDKEDFKLDRMRLQEQITRLQEQLFGLNDTIRQLATRS